MLKKKCNTNQLTEKPVAIYIKKTMNLKEKEKISSFLIWNAHNVFDKTGCQWRMLPKRFSQMAISLSLLLYPLDRAGIL